MNTLRKALDFILVKTVGGLDDRSGPQSSGGCVEGVSEWVKKRTDCRLCTLVCMDTILQLYRYFPL